MRWSRLKKTINPDDIASTVNSPAAKLRTPLKQPKEPKEMKNITKELQKEKRTERKAKIRAEHKIGAVVKNEEMQEEEEEAEASAEFEGNNMYGTNDGVNGEQTVTGQIDFGPVIVKIENGYMGANMLNMDQTLPNNDNIPSFLGATQPAFGLFQLPPSTPPNMFPTFVPDPLMSITPALSHEIVDETETEAWGGTITIKHELEHNPNTINPMFITSPAGSSASFSPGSSSVSPSVFSGKQPTQKWHAVSNSRARKTFGRSRKTADDQDEDLET